MKQTTRLLGDTGNEPVTVEEVAAWNHIDLSNAYALSTQERELLQQLITVARKQAEFRTNRAFTEQLWVLSLSAFPGNPIVYPGSVPIYYTLYNQGVRAIPLEHSPVSSVVSVVYRDSEGVLQLVDPTWYELTQDLVPRVSLRTGYNWPSVQEGDDAVQVTYHAGFYKQATAESPGEVDTVPPEVKQWIMAKCGELYTYRTTSTSDRLTAHSFWDELLSPYTIQEFNYYGQSVGR